MGLTIAESQATLDARFPTAPGTWSLAWVAAIPPAVADLSVAGGYAVEVEVTWPGSRPQTFAGASFQVARAIA